MTDDHGDRIEALEREIDGLGATVRGLTEELVEAKERIRQLENGTEPGTGASAESRTNAGSKSGADPTGSRSPEGADGEAESPTTPEDHGNPEEESETAPDGDEIIVA